MASRIAHSAPDELTSGFRFYIDVQPLVAEFLALCDGSRTASEAIAESEKRTVAVEKLHLPKFVTIRIASECPISDFFGSLVDPGFFLVFGCDGNRTAEAMRSSRKKTNADQRESCTSA